MKIGQNHQFHEIILSRNSIIDVTLITLKIKSWNSWFMNDSLVIDLFVKLLQFRDGGMVSLPVKWYHKERICQIAIFWINSANGYMLFIWAQDPSPSHPTNEHKSSIAFCQSLRLSGNQRNRSWRIWQSIFGWKRWASICSQS